MTLVNEPRGEVLYVGFCVKYADGHTKFLPHNVQRPIREIVFSHDEIEARLGVFDSFWQIWNTGGGPRSNPCVYYYLTGEVRPQYSGCHTNGFDHDHEKGCYTIINEKYSFPASEKRLTKEEVAKHRAHRQARGAITDIVLVIRYPDFSVRTMHLLSEGIDEVVFQSYEIHRRIGDNARFNAEWNYGNQNTNPCLLLKLGGTTPGYLLFGGNIYEGIHFTSKGKIIINNDRFFPIRSDFGEVPTH